MNFKVERRDPPWVVFLFFMSWNEGTRYIFSEDDQEVYGSKINGLTDYLKANPPPRQVVLINIKDYPQLMGLGSDPNDPEKPKYKKHMEEMAGIDQVLEEKGVRTSRVIYYDPDKGIGYSSNDVIYDERDLEDLGLLPKSDSRVIEGG